MEWLTGRQECKTFQVLSKEQRKNFNQKGSVTGHCILLILLRIRPFICHLSMMLLAYSYPISSHSFISTILLVAAGTLITANSRAGLGEAQVINC